MAFNFFKNPFEKLSADNQQEMKQLLQEQNEYFMDSGKNTIVLGLGRVEDQLKSLNGKLDVLTSTLKETAGGKFDEKELKKAGVASMALGDGMEKIVTAIKMFGKVDPDVVDRFVSGIEKIGESFQKLGEGLKTVELAGKVLLNMAKGLILFGLALLFAGPIYLLALPLAPIVIGIVLGLMYLFTKVLGDKEAMKGVKKGAGALQQIALSITLFGLALLLSGPIYKAAMSWSLLLVLGVVLVVVGLMLLIGWAYEKGPGGNSIKDGIEALMWMGIAIVVFGVALVAASHIYKYLWKEQVDGMLIIGMVVLTAVGVLIHLGKARKRVLKGAQAMVIMALAIIVLAIGMFIFAKMFPANPQNWETLGLIGATIGGLTAVLIVLGAMKSNVMTGAIALILGSASLIVLSVALKMFTKTANNGYDWERFGLLMATIAGIAVEFGIIGIPVVAGFVMFGAVAMMVASASIIVLSKGLDEWRKVGFKDKDAKDLQKAVTRIPMAFLGLTGDEGFFGAIKQAAKTTMVLSAASINALMMIGIGSSLLVVGKGLKAFKDTGFTPADAENIRKIISSVAVAFVEATDDNDDFSWWDVMWGIFAMRNLGRTLKGIAEGVQAWANLYVSEYEYDEKSGRMVEVNRVKLTKSDFDNVAYGMKQVIGAVANPLAEVGKADAGEGTGFWASVFGGNGYVRKGVRALQGVGNVLTGLAAGVQSFANLTVSEWEMVEQADGSMKLQEVSRKKMSKKDFMRAKIAMQQVVGWAAEEFAEVGKVNEGGGQSGSYWSRIFGGDYIKSGVESLTGIGDIMTGLAQGVIDFANMNFVTQKVGTDDKGNPVLQPDKIIKMTPAHIKTAMQNMRMVVGTTADVFAEVGKAEEEGSWFFSNDYVSKGIKALTGVGGVMTGLAEGIRGFAFMEFVKHEVKEIDGVPTLVPKGVFRMNPKHIEMAGYHMEKVLGVTVNAIVNFAKKYKGKEEKIQAALGFIGKLNTKIKGIGEAMVKMSEGMEKIKAFDKFTANITTFLESFINPFDPEHHGQIGITLDNFTVFTKNVQSLSKSAKKMESIDKSFQGIAKSMNTFKDGVNGLDMKLLTQTKGLFEAMAIIADAGTAEEVLAKYGNTLDETFKNLADLLANFGDQVSQSTDEITQQTKKQTENQEGFFQTMQNQQKRAEQMPPAINAQNTQMLSQLQEIADILRGTLKVREAGLGGF